MNKITYIGLAVIGIVVIVLFVVFLPTNEDFVTSEQDKPIDTISNEYNSNYDVDDFVLDQKIFGNLELIESSYIKEYQLENGTWPMGILVSKTGEVWVGGTQSHKILSFDPISERIKNSYDIPNNSHSESQNPKMIWSMVEDKNGLIWFSQTGNNPLWIFNPTTEEFTLQDEVKSAAIQLEVSPRTGNIWFTDTDQDIVGVIQNVQSQNSDDFIVSEFVLHEDAGPFGLYVDYNEKIWVTQPTNGVIYQYKPIVNETKITDIPTEFELRHSNSTVFYYPSDVLVNEDTIWFTEHLTNYFLEYDRNTDELQRYPTSINPHHYGTLPFWMKWDLASQGFWFVEHFGNRVAFFNTTDYSLTEYEIPTRDPNWGYISNAINISTDPTNPNILWFSELYTDKIGVVDRSIEIPFDIRTNQKTIILDKTQDETSIGFVVDVKPTSSTQIRNDELFLKKSSTIVASGGFGNITAQFDANSFEIKDDMQIHEGRLYLSNFENIESGNYTVAVSVTDGAVTKTDYSKILIIP